MNAKQIKQHLDVITAFAKKDLIEYQSQTDGKWQNLNPDTDGFSVERLVSGEARLRVKQVRVLPNDVSRCAGVTTDGKLALPCRDCARRVTARRDAWQVRPGVELKNDWCGLYIKA